MNIRFGLNALESRRVIVTTREQAAQIIFNARLNALESGPIIVTRYLSINKMPDCKSQCPGKRADHCYLR